MFTLADLERKAIADLKAIAAEFGVRSEGDKRKKVSWINALQKYNDASTELDGDKPDNRTALLASKGSIEFLEPGGDGNSTNGDVASSPGMTNPGPGHPISFGKTLDCLLHGGKTVTRRVWSDAYANHFIKRFERGLTVPAFDKDRRYGGKQIGELHLTHRPYKEWISQMPVADLVAEGGMCATAQEFIDKYFDGRDQQVWVIRFQFFPCQLEPLNSSQESEAFDSALKPLEASNLTEPVKSATLPARFTPTTGQKLSSSATSERSASSPVSATALLEAAPAKNSAYAGSDLVSVANALPSGGKCCGLSPSVIPPLLDGKTLRVPSATELEKWLPASKWQAIKSKAQSLYRQRNLERHINASGFSSLPTPTTYAKSCNPTRSGPSGTTRLEDSLRSPVLPTPRAKDGSQGYNSGKTGGMNLTGYLKRPIQPAIKPEESANPAVWAWMMGFPTGWAESVLMDGGAEIRPPKAPAFLASE